MELILYNASANIERQFGSIKFAVRLLYRSNFLPILTSQKSFITVSAILSSTLSFITLLALHRLGINYLPAGPTSIIFSILYQYYRLVPSAYTFQIFALKFSNKSFLYILALQVSIHCMNALDAELKPFKSVQLAIFQGRQLLPSWVC